MSRARGRIKAGLRGALRRIPRKPRPAILTYHRIGRETFDPWGLAVEANCFEAQAEWLARNRTVLPLSEFARLHQEQGLPRDAVSLTFDDGYASVVEAVPALTEHGLDATVFLPAELIERGGKFWWDELADLILAWSADELRLDDARHPVPSADERDPLWPPLTAPRTPRQRLFQTLWSKLSMRAPAALDAAMTELRDQVPAVASSIEDRPLSPQQVRSIHPTIEFGSHGLTHPSLPNLSDDEKSREIAESRAECARLTGNAPIAFAYPYGKLDQASVRLVEQAGFTCACATGDKFIGWRSNVFALPRLRVGNWDAGDLRDMLGG